MRYTFDVDDDTGVVVLRPYKLLPGPENAKTIICTIPVANMTPLERFNLYLGSRVIKKDGAMSCCRDVLGGNMMTLLGAWRYVIPQ